MSYVTERLPAQDPATTNIPFCSVSILARQRRGRLAFLMMKSVRKYGFEAGRELWKFPGGMQEPLDSANPLRALNRELREETGFHLRPNHPVDPPVLQRERMPDGHFRYFYLLWRNDVRGMLRSEVVEDYSNILHVPIWVDMEFIEANLCKSMRGVLQRLRKFNKEGAFR